MDSRPLYNSRIVDTYLKLLCDRYADADVSEMLHYAGMESYEVADQGHWFTQTQINLFHEKCVKLTGNVNISREAGRFAATPGTLGTMRHYGLSLAGPLKAFSLIGAATKKFVRSSEYSSRKISDTKVEITVKPLPGTKEESFQCANRVGFFEAIINVFNLPTPKIEHPECVFNGGTTCRYIISWSHDRLTTIRRIRDVTCLSGIITTLLTLVFGSIPVFAVALTVSAVTGLSLAWYVDHVRAVEQEKIMTHHWEAYDQLTDQIDHNYRNTQLAAKIGDVVVNQTHIEHVIDLVIHVLQKELGYDRGLFLLADDESKRLEIRGAYGYSEQHRDLLTNMSFNLGNPDSRGMFVVSYRTQKPFLINDVDEIIGDLSSKSREFVLALGTRSFLCVPIVLKGKSIGILAVDNLKTKSPLVVSDINLLMGITPAIGVSIQNTRLLAARAEQFESTLQVLAGSIDARDFLTAGHSEKVAVYAMGIAEELGLKEEECRVIRMAALLHDYGKIGIEDSILKKAGPLTDAEQEIIRTHPTKTLRILEKMAFEGAYREIPEMCHAHHEKWDGTGYPNALKGEEIPLGARIITVADVYEAITAERHYRDPMTETEALRIVKSESGKHFQPEIVEAFLRYLDRGTAHSVGNKNRPGPRERTLWGFPHTHRVAYRTEISAKVGHRVITGTSVNISRGGIYISSPEAVKLTPGTDIQITFTLPVKNTLVQLKSKVAWINTHPQSKPLLPEGFGAYFSKLDAKMQNVLNGYIETRLDPARKATF